jgi:uncharacterized protein YegP (UPF0339 family)
MGKFVISKKKNGDYQFNFKGRNNQIILNSEGYFEKTNCRNGIERVKKYSQIDDRFRKTTTTDGKFYFELKGGNGLVMATSKLYESTSERDNALEFFKINVLSATTKDKTSKNKFL